jgi:hypothetical protein
MSLPDHGPRGTAGDGPSQGLVVITARIHSRARLCSFSEAQGVGLFRQPHAISSKLLETLF